MIEIVKEKAQKWLDGNIDNKTKEQVKHLATFVLFL